MLESLKSAHANLSKAVDELQQLTKGPCPNRGAFVDVRWKLSKASLDRRLLWGRIHLYLSRRLSPATEQVLRELQEKDIKLLRTSSAHVAKWTPEAIIKDWAAYCRASETMTSRMLDEMRGEKQSLYPILEDLAGSR